MIAGVATIRRPVWRGVQPIAALWFPHGWLPVDERVARLVAEWRPGARAARHRDGDILYFPDPVERACDDCRGMPLCRVGAGLLASAPLDAREIEQFAGADIGIVGGARLATLRAADGAPIDLAGEIDLDDYALHDTYACDDVAAPHAYEQLVGKRVRDVVGDAVAPPSTERNAFMDALAQQHKRGDGRRAFDGLVGGANLLVQALRRLFGRASAASPRDAVAARPRAPRVQRWREWLVRTAMLTRVSHLIGHRQAAHLERVMRLFDEGNVDEALRNAPPLDGDGDGSTPSIGPSFGFFMRRSSLRLSAHAAGGSASIGVGAELMEHLRRLYRRTFERLDRAGRIDEAVFVLAELIDSKHEALDYLAKHGRHEQAADLALGWNMPAPTIVRFLVLAGDVARAIKVARRDDAFADVVAHIEPTDTELAHTLRCEWGAALVARGEWLAAVDAVWPVPHAQALATEWLIAAESAGEELSARALVQRAALLPDTLERHAARIEALAAAQGSSVARAAFAQALLDTTRRGPGIRLAAAAVLPMVAADRAAGANALTRDNLNRLAHLADDALLRADLPSWTLGRTDDRGRLLQRSDALVLPVPPAGLHAIYDAVCIGRDRWLVALGETGVAIVGASGRIARRYAVPATQLVISTSRNVAIAIAPRGSVKHLSRIDLVRHVATDLGTMPIRFHDETFDGIGWTVVSDNRILVVDTTSATRDVLWHVGDLPGAIVAARFGSQHQTFYVRTSRGIDEWQYAVPGRRLLRRSPTPLNEYDVQNLNSSGTPLYLKVSRDHAQRTIVDYEGAGSKRPLVVDDAARELFGSQCFEELVLLIVDRGETHHHRLHRLNGGDCVATLDWPAKPPARARQVDNHLLWFDERGRLLDVDLESSLTRTVSIL